MGTSPAKYQLHQTHSGKLRSSLNQPVVSNLSHIIEFRGNSCMTILQVNLFNGLSSAASNIFQQDDTWL